MKKLTSQIRFNWVVLVFIYLVVIAGSLVRVTGSGMGCPDWPKCFGYWIPPTSDEVLPENYQENYVAYRVKKIDRFSGFLNKIGLSKTADQVKNDPNLTNEQPFNAAKTWTEYGNRLCGALAGLGMLIGWGWVTFRTKFRKIKWIYTINLFILVVQAWFGSIVVASNLVPWTITLHMFLALVIIGLHLWVIHLLQIERAKQETDKPLPVLVFPKWFTVLLIISTIITTYQMFLGTQVREMIDEMTIQGYTREDWTSMLGLPYLIHRSFAWLVLILIVFMTIYNEANGKYKVIRIIGLMLLIELITGITLAYANMPAVSQVAHLLFAAVLFGVFLKIILNQYSKLKK